MVLRDATATATALWYLHAEGIDGEIAAFLCLVVSVVDLANLAYSRFLRGRRRKRAARKRLARDGVAVSGADFIGEEDLDKGVEFAHSTFGRRSSAASPTRSIMTLDEQAANLDVLAKCLARNAVSGGPSEAPAVASRAPPLTVVEQVDLRAAIDAAMARYRALRASASDAAARRARDTVLLRRDRPRGRSSASSSVGSVGDAPAAAAAAPGWRDRLAASPLGRVLSPRRPAPTHFPAADDGAPAPIV